MISKIKNFIKALLTGNFKYIFSGSILITKKGAVVKLGKGVKILNSKIEIGSLGILEIGDGCLIQNVEMFVNGKVSFKKNNIIESGYNLRKPQIIIESGAFDLGFKNKIRCNVLVRFGGTLKIGEYNNINEETEIRADELITIGDFNQISYKCNIWDTNTHNIYSDEKRREFTIKHYPGYEFEKPITAPVIIGSDCWIGKEAAILKGVTVNNSSIVGFKTVLTGCIIPSDTTVVTAANTLKFARKVKS
jgi:acetyltransferase-like isoleucine patch superfamily enzyme